MESNQEFMILSLLNLYLSYIDIQNDKDKTKMKPIYRKRLDAQLYEKKKQESHTNIKIVHVTSIPAVEESEVAEVVQQSLLQDTSQIIEWTSGRQETVASRKVRREKGKKKVPIKKPRIRRWKVRPTNQDRATTGFHRKVFPTIKKMDHEHFFLHTRMSKPIFDWLLSFTQKSLLKKRQKVLAEERLAITLNYLAYGTPLQSLAFKHKLGKTTIRQVILDTCSVLWTLLSPIYLSEPTTSQYSDIADDFKTKWCISNCVGAIDGKHVAISIPSKKKLYCDDKYYYTVLLMGVCDANYKFTAVSVESFENRSDEEIFRSSPFGKALFSDQLPLPSCKPLFQSSPPFPYYFIADTALSLRKNLMRPYAETELDTTKAIFNYKISRARTITENCFGILTARWRVLLTTIEFLPENCKTIILACLALHNYIMTNDDQKLYCPKDFIDREGEYGNIEPGEWRNELKKNGDSPLESVTSNTHNFTYEAKKLRDTLANLFVNEEISYHIEIV